MLSSVNNAARTLATSAARSMSSGATVGVVGASGGIGAPLSLLLKASPLVGDLRLSDMVNSVGVAADLGHINTEGDVFGLDGPDKMEEVLKGCKAVVIPAGVPRKPGMTRDDLFNTNAGIVQSIGNVIAKACPDAFVLIISNPVNSTVPIMAETLKKHGCYDKRKVMGVTTLDITRANTFVAKELGIAMSKINVPVIGGHAGTTILPLLSHVTQGKLSAEAIERLSHRIAFGGDEVVQAKAGAGSATLSMAFAAAHFTERLLKAAAGEQGITECCYVESPVASSHGCDYFSTPCLLGPNGVEQIGELPKMSEFEQKLFNEMIGDLAAQVKKGIAFCAK